MNKSKMLIQARDRALVLGSVSSTNTPNAHRMLKKALALADFAELIIETVENGNAVNSIDQIDTLWVQSQVAAVLNEKADLYYSRGNTKPIFTAKLPTRHDMGEVFKSLSIDPAIFDGSDEDIYQAFVAEYRRRRDAQPTPEGRRAKQITHSARKRRDRRKPGKTGKVTLV